MLAICLKTATLGNVTQALSICSGLLSLASCPLVGTVVANFVSLVSTQQKRQTQKGWLILGLQLISIWHNLLSAEIEGCDAYSLATLKSFVLQQPQFVSR